MKAERRLQNYLIRGSHSFTVLSIASPSLSLSLYLMHLSFYSLLCISNTRHLSLCLTLSFFLFERSVGCFYNICRVGIWCFSSILPRNFASNIKAFAFTIAPPTLLISTTRFPWQPLYWLASGCSYLAWSHWLEAQYVLLPIRCTDWWFSFIKGFTIKLICIR